MAALACPQCGNELTYASPALPVKVCDRCRSLVVRNDQQLERVGEA
jgi:ribosomal protein S27E